MIVVISITILIFGILFYFLGPKKIRFNNLIHLLINRLMIAFLLALVILGFSYLYLFYWSDLLPKSNFKDLLDIFLGFPTTFVLIIGFSEGVGLAIIAMVAELLVLTLIIRLLIPKRWPVTLIEGLKLKQR